MAAMSRSRLAGSFSSALRTIASSSRGISGRSRDGGTGCSWSCLVRTAACVLARNGAVPVSISYSTMPNEYMSVFSVMSCPSICSGDM